MSKVPIQAGRFSRRPPGTRRPGTVSVARPSAICRYYNGNVGDTTEVGKYPKGASPYGVLNMAGNVWEWVNDWYDENYYGNSPSENPQGPSTGDYRVLRGGSWYVIGYYVRAAARGRNVPTNRDNFIGFRCSLSTFP